jgi:hypothetical protein
MDTMTFDSLCRYETTSWAYWHPDEDSSIEWFRTLRDRLHGRTVFLGLNRSEKWPANLDGTHLPNFHTRGHAGDRRLKRFVQDAQLDNLIGGFMTDLSEEICSRSDKVKIDIEAAMTSLREKIDLIGREEKRAVIAFGDKTFESLRKGLGMKNSAVVEHKDHRTAKFDANFADELWTVYRVWHPGNYGQYREKVEKQLPQQLRYINIRSHFVLSR